jgi:hypothetical protein
VRLALLAGALVLLVFAAPSAAQGAVPRGFVGVMGDGPLFSTAVNLDREVDLMAGAGVESMRVAFYWAHAQPSSTASPSFTVTDRVVASAARRRIEILPVVVLAPAWARLRPRETWSPPAPAAYARYAAYVAALVARYRPGGTFWAERPWLPPVPIRSWQVWNEPNGPRFWSLQPGLPEYAELLRVTRIAIKQADPRARVVLAGLTDRSWTALAQLYRLGIKANTDVIALNPFTALPRNLVKIVKRARAVMARYGDAKKALLITETSWPSAQGHVTNPFGYEETEAGQARRLTEVLGALARHRRALRIRQVFWYTWMSRDRDTRYSFDWAGVRRLSGTTIATKPAYWALKKAARGLAGCAAKRRPARCSR